MTEANTQILIGLATGVTDSLTALQLATKKVAELDIMAKEYERQIAFHLAKSPPDEYNATVVAGRLTPVYAEIATAKLQAVAAQKAYDDAILKYNTAKDTVLTPEEKAEVVINANSNAAIALAEQKIKGEQAKQEAETKAAEAKANYADKTGQTILIIGIVFVVIIVVSYFIYKAKKKKATGAAAAAAA